MPFKEGHSGNKHGRPKGSKNKTTANLREWVNSFIHGNKSQIEKDWKKLTPRDRIILFEKLLKYTLPTLQSTTIKPDIDDLSEDQLKTIAQEMLTSLKNDL